MSTGGGQIVARSLWPSLMLGAAVWLGGAVPAARGEPATYIDQGWPPEVRELFYFTPQGSRIIPYKWFMALETVDGRGLFADPAHLARYGFIYADGPHPLNPGGLPIGFAIDP